MVTRREMLQGVAAGAVAGGLLPKVYGRETAATLDPGCRRGLEHVGPLLPTPPEALKRWMGARYGAFLHWGPCTVLGQEISWSRQVHVPPHVYDNLYKRFNPVEFDAEAWVRMLKESGFRYAVFVSKHHDGFAMWNTKTTPHSIMHTPFQRDVLGELSAACKKHNFLLCLYYSIADIYQPDCIGSRHANGEYLGPPGYELPGGEKPDFDRYVRYMKAQLRELTENYGPILAWWFDGGWMQEWTYDRGVDLLKYMRSLQADTLADQRVGCAYNGRVYMPTWFPTDVKHVGDFAVLEVEMPRFDRRIPWEYTTPANGRSYAWTPGSYGEPDSWIDNLTKSACGDGNYLLGLEAPQSGRFDPELMDKLRESSLWLQRYGASVFDTRGGPYMRTSVYGATCRGNRIYLHVFDRSLSKLSLPPLPLKVDRAYMLNGGKVQVTQNREALVVDISPNDMETPSTIVVLEVHGSAEDIAPIGEIPVNRNATVRSSNADASLDKAVSDGSMCTYWKSDGKTEQPWIEFDLGIERSVSRAILFEGWYQGQFANIHRFEIDVETGGKWKQVADVTAWGQGTPTEHAFDNWPMAVFHQEVRFAPVSARRVRLKITRATAAPVIHEFQLYER
ncbi:MAG TPA: alpha-L-fucosidase [Steroidobacteraceae bacterium]|nr:alpha-L-fucosidase [Steroidobacteraceae bacterium]